MGNANPTCAYGPCQCTVSPEQAVQRNDQRFCSERCADGQGCDHQDCHCDGFRTEDAPAAASMLDHSPTENLQRTMAAQRNDSRRPPTSVPLWGGITLVAVFFAFLAFLIFLWGKAS